MLAQCLRVYRVVLVTTLGWTLVKEKSYVSQGFEFPCVRPWVLPINWASSRYCRENYSSGPHAYAIDLFCKSTSLYSVFIRFLSSARVVVLGQPFRAVQNNYFSLIFDIFILIIMIADLSYGAGTGG